MKQKEWCLRLLDRIQEFRRRVDRGPFISAGDLDSIWVLDGDSPEKGLVTVVEPLVLRPVPMHQILSLSSDDVRFKRSVR